MKTWRAGVIVTLALAGWGCGPSSAPDVKLRPLGRDETVTLASFRGKPVLLDFWATWCGPCRQTMPDLQKLYDEFKGRGLQVIAVSQESAPEVKKFLSSNPYTYPFYLDLDGSANEAFRVQGIPQSFVIDAKGTVVWSGHPGETALLRRAVESVLTP